MAKSEGIVNSPSFRNCLNRPSCASSTLQHLSALTLGSNLLSGASCCELQWCCNLYSPVLGISVCRSKWSSCGLLGILKPACLPSECLPCEHQGQSWQAWVVFYKHTSTYVWRKIRWRIIHLFLWFEEIMGCNWLPFSNDLCALKESSALFHVIAFSKCGYLW